MDARDSNEPLLSASIASMATVVRGWIGNLPRRERDAWGLVLLVFTADVVLTYRGIQVGLAEGNPLMAYAMGAGGILALIAAKTIVLVVAGLVRYRRPADGAAIALGVAIPWLGAVLVNAATLL